MTEQRQLSLFVAADVHGLGGKSHLTEVLALVKADDSAIQPEIVMLGGDYVGAGKPPSTEEERLSRWQPRFSVAELQQEIADVFGSGVKSFFTYASHDKNEMTGGEVFFHGPADCIDYYLYGISFAQMHFCDEEALKISGYDGLDRNLGSAQTAAERFLQWASSLNDHKPIFVMSHLPLHAHRGDNCGAEAWCTALNNVAEQHSVFVFFAHNHSTERRTPYDRAFYLLPKGSTMQVQGEDRTHTVEVRLNFTYLNAGYILHGCGTLLTLSDTDGSGRCGELRIQRYAAKPEDTAFGTTGILSPYYCTV